MASALSEEEFHRMQVSYLCPASRTYRHTNHTVVTQDVHLKNVFPKKMNLLIFW